MSVHGYGTARRGADRGGWCVGTGRCRREARRRRGGRGIGRRSCIGRRWRVCVGWCGRGRFWYRWFGRWQRGFGGWRHWLGGRDGRRALRLTGWFGGRGGVRRRYPGHSRRGRSPGCRPLVPVQHYGRRGARCDQADRQQGSQEYPQPDRRASTISTFIFTSGPGWGRSP